MMAFKHDVCLHALCHLPGLGEAVIVADAGAPVHPVEFLRMWCEECPLRNLLQPRLVCAEYVQCVGVKDERLACPLYLRYQRCRCRVALSETRPYGNSVIGLIIDRLREAQLVCVNMYYRLWDRYLHYVIVALWDVGCHLPRSATEACPGSESRRACHAIASGNYQRMPHGALMCEIAACPEQRDNIVMLKE